MQDGKEFERTRKPFLTRMPRLFLSLSFVRGYLSHNRKCSQALLSVFSVVSMLPNPMVHSQPLLLSPTIFDTAVYVPYLGTLLPLAFGRQEPSSFSSILLTFLDWFPLPSECWRTQALVHFLSLVSFLSSLFYFPVYI